MMRRGLAVLLILLITANIAESQTMASEGGDGEEEDFHTYFQDYFTYDSMMDALDMIENEHSDIVKIYDLTDRIKGNDKGIPGHTWQGRSVWAVKVSDGVDEEVDYYSDPEEADVLIVGAHHGNEWPSFEVCMYLLFYLTEYYGEPLTDNDGDGKVNEDPMDMVDNDDDGLIDEDENEGRITWLVDNREIWIVPMLNPDGVDMDQRQNGREEVPGGPGGSSLPTNGVDINRNYPYMWDSEPDPNTGMTMDTGDRYSSTYRGPNDNHDDDDDAVVEYEFDIHDKIFKETWRQIDEDPMDDIDNDNDGLIDEDIDGGFSEPETMAMYYLVDDYFRTHEGATEKKDYNIWESDFIASISYHTHGAMILYPWGYSRDPTSHDALFQYMGQELSYFNGYDVMQGPELYPTSGDFDDWLYGKYGIMAYTFELNAGSHKGEAGDIINISRANLPCNLYIAEMAPQIEVARERYKPDLDIGLPVINHTQTKTVVNSDSTYTVEVELSNAEKLDKNSIYLYYKVGESGEWKEKLMGTRDDEHYRATIPRQSGGKHVYYYIEGKANYEEAKSISEVIYISSPKYGQYDPYSYFVDISLGDTFGDIAAMILMMALVFGIVYYGLGKSLKMALDAEKRKNYL